MLFRSTIVPPSKHPKGTTYTYAIEPKGALSLLDPAECGLLPEGAKVQSVQADSHTTNTTSNHSNNLNDSNHSNDSNNSYHSYSPGCELSVAEVIKMTLPTQAGQRHKCIFNLARGLKYNCGLFGRRAAELKPVVRQWYDLAEPNITTKSFVTTWRDFLEAFRTARTPLGNPITDAFEAALTPSSNEELETYLATECDSETLVRIMRVCWYFACHANGGEFFISNPTTLVRPISNKR